MRGRCSRCRYSFRLRKDGTVQTHYLYCGSARNYDPCGGSGLLPWVAGEEVVTGELHIDRIAPQPVRDALRQAVRSAGHGETVWIIGKDGSRLGAIVSVQRAMRGPSATSGGIRSKDIRPQFLDGEP